MRYIDLSVGYASSEPVNPNVLLDADNYCFIQCVVEQNKQTSYMTVGCQVQYLVSNI